MRKLGAGCFRLSHWADQAWEGQLFSQVSVVWAVFVSNICEYCLRICKQTYFSRCLLRCLAVLSKAHLDYVQVTTSVWLDKDCVWIYLLRLHWNVRANSFKFTVQRVGSPCIIHIVAIYSGCALILSLCQVSRLKIKCQWRWGCNLCQGTKPSLPTCGVLPSF